MDAPFRKELIEARPNQWLGTAHLATPLPLLWLTCLAAAFTTSIVLLLVFGHYTRRETIAGQLVPNAGILRVHSHAIGTVTRVFVHEGENVSRGAPLVEVSGERSSAALGSTGAIIATELNAQEQRLSAQLQNQESLARNQLSGLETRLEMLREQSEQIDGQIALGQQRVQSSSAMLAKLLPLRKDGYISAYQYAQQEAEVLQLQSQLKDLARQKLDARQQISQAKQQIDQIPLDLAERQAALQQSLLDRPEFHRHSGTALRIAPFKLYR